MANVMDNVMNFFKGNKGDNDVDDDGDVKSMSVPTSSQQTQTQIKVYNQKQIQATELMLKTGNNLFSTLDNLIQFLKQKRNATDCADMNETVTSMLLVFKHQIKIIKKDGYQNVVYILSGLLKNYINSKGNDIKLIKPFIEYAYCIVKGAKVHKIPEIQYNNDGSLSWNNALANNSMSDFISKNHVIGDLIKEIINNPQQYAKQHQKLYDQFGDGQQNDFYLGNPKAPSLNELFKMSGNNIQFKSNNNNNNNNVQVPLVVQKAANGDDFDDDDNYVVNNNDLNHMLNRLQDQNHGIKMNVYSSNGMYKESKIFLDLSINNNTNGKCMVITNSKSNVKDTIYFSNMQQIGTGNGIKNFQNSNLKNEECFWICFMSNNKIKFYGFHWKKKDIMLLTKILQKYNPNN